MSGETSVSLRERIQHFHLELGAEGCVSCQYREIGTFREVYYCTYLRYFLEWGEVLHGTISFF